MKFACTYTKTKKSYKEKLMDDSFKCVFCILWTRELRIQLFVELRKMI